MKRLVISMFLAVMLIGMCSTTIAQVRDIEKAIVGSWIIQGYDDKEWTFGADGTFKIGTSTDVGKYSLVGNAVVKLYVIHPSLVSYCHVRFGDWFVNMSRDGNALIINSMVECGNDLWLIRK